MNDGTLQKEYKCYRERLAFIGVLGMKDKSDATVQDLSTAVKDIEEDISYINTSEFLPASTTYMYVVCVCVSFWNSLHVRGYTRPLSIVYVQQQSPSIVVLGTKP